MVLICISLIPVVEGGMIWFLILFAGVFVDGFMSIIAALLLESEGIESVHSGTVLGIVFTLMHLGYVVSPPLGNSLATPNNLGIPFFFWASYSVPALIMLIFIKETGSRGAHNNITQ